MIAKFPYSRLRRNRLMPWIRRALTETSLRPSDFFLPLFIREADYPAIIDGMPGILRLTIDEAVEAAIVARDLGISAVMVFPAGSPRSAEAYEAYSDDNLIVRAVAQIKKQVHGIGVIADVALDPYTIDGHDGITKDGIVVNDLTISILCKQALSQARAGVDCVAPSDMMDGRVQAIRHTLDMNGFENVGIISYSAKFCSRLYATFRVAIGANPETSGAIDKSNYQLNSANSREAMREIQQDIDEGADIIIVKPALLYLDIIKEAASSFNCPISGYVVSGEYSMLASQHDNKLMVEAYTGVKRAGASIIIAYNAIEMARIITQI